MKNFLKNIFRPRLKSFLIEDKFRIELAFSYEGVDYYHFPDQFQVPAGRQMMALAYYEELEMRVDKEYLKQHTDAMEKILSDPQKISIQNIARLNMNMKERMQLLPMPDFIYRLGSIMFFDKTESIFTYDYEYNQKKIERWKKGGSVLDFFLQTPLSGLILSFGIAEQNSQMYFQVVEKIDRTHREHLSDILLAGQ